MLTDVEDKKNDLILELFKSNKIENSVIYCKSLESVASLTQFLEIEEIKVINMV